MQENPGLCSGSGQSAAPGRLGCDAVRSSSESRGNFGILVDCERLELMLATNTRWLCSSTSSSRLSKQFSEGEIRAYLPLCKNREIRSRALKKRPRFIERFEYQDDLRHPLAVIVHSARNVTDAANHVANRRYLFMGIAAAMADGRRTQNLAMFERSDYLVVTASVLHKSEQANLTHDTNVGISSDTEVAGRSRKTADGGMKLRVCLS